MNINKVNTVQLYSTLNITATKWYNINLYLEAFHNHYQGLILDNQLINHKLAAFTSTTSNQFKINKKWSAELSGLYRTRILSGQGYFQPITRLNTSIRKKLFQDKATLGLVVRDILHSWKIKREITLNEAIINTFNFSDTQIVNLTFTYLFGKTIKSKPRKDSLENEKQRAGVNN